MKTSFYALVFLLLYAGHLNAIDSKITQIIHVERENTHNQESNMLYFVTKNHELCCDNADTIKTNEDIGSKLTLREFSTKTEQYHPIEDRVVLIGQPMYIIDKIWKMPAVIKKKGMLGALLSPEICLIEYRKLAPNEISNEPEPFFNKYKDITIEHAEYDIETESESEDESYFVIERLAKGHRTKVTKIGFQEDTNREEYPMLVSGSEWPTVKIHNIVDENLTEEIPLTHLFDIVNNNTLKGLVKPNLLHNEFIFEDFSITEKDSDNFTIKPTKISYLPAMFFDSTKNYPENFIYKTFTNYFAQAVISQKNWKNSTFFISSDYAIGFFPQLKQCNIYIKNKDDNQLNFTDPKVIDLTENDRSLQNTSVVITACAYDFANNTLFYATYNKGKPVTVMEHTESKALLKKQVLNQLIETEETEEIVTVED